MSSAVLQVIIFRYALFANEQQIQIQIQLKTQTQASKHIEHTLTK